MVNYGTETGELGFAHDRRVQRNTHEPVRWATIKGAQDLPTYNEGAELPDHGTGTE
jgi:hypothetical protein